MSLASTAIVAGGIGLGTVLSTFVQPIPLHAPEPAWKTMLSTPIAVASQPENVAYYGSMPQDLNPPRHAGEENPEWLAEAERDAQAELMAANYSPPAEPAAEPAEPAMAAIPHYRALEAAAADTQTAEPETGPAVVVTPPDLTAQPTPIDAG